MFPILGRYGSFFLYSFTVVMAAGILLGLGLAACWRRDEADERWLDTAVFVTLIAWLGARAGFVAGNWAYYTERPAEIWQFWQGGLSYHGALLAGLAALWGWSAWRKRPFARDAARLAPALILVAAFGWLACYLEGCAYGAETSLGPLAADLPDSYGVFALRYQTQLIGFVLTLLILPLILWLGRKRPDTAVFWFAILLLSLIHLLVGAMRADTGRLSNLLDAGLVILAFILYKTYPVCFVCPNSN